MLHLKLLKPCLITNTIRLIKPWTSPSKNNFTNHFNHRCYPSTHMSALANGTRYSPSRIHTHPDRPTCVSLRTSSSWIRAQSPYTFFLHEIDSSLGEGDSVYRGIGGRRLITEYMGREDGRKADPLTRSGSSRRRPGNVRLSRFSNCSLSPPPSLPPSLPFDFDAFPLCYRLSLCACRPWRGKRLHPLPLELVSFNNHHHHHHQRHYEGKRLGDFPQSLCASDAFSSGDLSAKISDPLSLPLSFSLRGSVIQGFN